MTLRFDPTEVEKYRKQLMAKSPEEIAAEAALMVGYSRHKPGNMTSAILRWAAEQYGEHSPRHREFLKLYAAELAEVKAKRKLGLMERPTIRPIMGPKGGPQLKDFPFAERQKVHA